MQTPSGMEIKNKNPLLHYNHENHKLDPYNFEMLLTWFVDFTKIC